MGESKADGGKRKEKGGDDTVKAQDSVVGANINAPQCVKTPHVMH